METFDSFLLIAAKPEVLQLAQRYLEIENWGEKKAEGVGVIDTNRLIDTDFEKSKIEKLLNKL